jgi:DNA adenine methylase
VLQLEALTPVPTQPLKPPLKWAGGKRWLVQHLRSTWEAYSQRRYVEPFCGGLALPLAFTPRRALLNDTNPHLISFYHWVQRGLEVSIDMRNDKDLYYRHRFDFNQQVREGKAHTRRVAEIFYYLNRTCYNGLCRFNRKGEFNVPFGRHTTINYTHDFTSYVESMGRWQFENRDFEALQLRSGDFVYADPPYDVEFTQYSKEAFGWDEQVRLANWLAGHDGPVVLSNQKTDRIVDLYDGLGYDLEYTPAPRMISCNGDRTKAIEVIATRGFR